MTLSATVNGHSVELTRLPVWSQDNSYLLWELQRQILAVNARFPLNGVSIVREPSSVPAHYHVIIDVAADSAWKFHVVFDDLANPKFGVEETVHAAWRWSLVEASRGLRSAIMDMLIANPSLIDTCVFTIAP